MTTALRAEERAAPYLVAPLLTDQLDTFAGAPEGFRRLRELVLNLAVRGMLVPQDAKDEPAEKLLDAVPISVRQPHAIPSTWAWAPLGQLADIRIGKTPPTKETRYWATSGFPWVSISDMDDYGLVKATTRTVSQEAVEEIFRGRHSPAGTLLMSFKLTVGRTAILDIDAFHNEAIVSLFPAPGIVAPYLFLLLPIFTREGATKDAIKGATLNSDSLKSLPIALPPTAEQSRIVAKVEELMALIAALEAKVGAGETARGKLLDTLLAALADSPNAAATADAWAQLAPHFDLLLQTPADVDRLQQTLLQLAVKGRLVPQDPKDEPAAELLKRIRAEKERLVTEGKFKRDKPLPAINEDTLPYELPQCWHWSRLGSLGDSFDYGTSQKATETPRGTPVLRMGNVQTGTVTLTNLKYFEDGQCELPYLYLQPGDLLFNRTNSYELVGKTGIFKGEPQRYSFASYLIRIRANTHAIDPQYLNLYMNSLNCRLTQIEPQVVQQNGQANFNGTKLQAICIPLPPLPEQSRIVAAIASLTTLCDRLRERLTARRALSAKLAAALTESALQ
jgi:type I restriction enzyme S subunit